MGCSIKRQETTERIIQAAMAVFSREGFNGARVDEIAREAGVNKATLYYHVGDKEALYAAVLHNALGSTASRIEQAAMVSDLPPGDRLRAYVRSFARAVDDHPQMTPIMMRELASGGRNLPGEVVEDFGRIIAVISAILDEGCRRGVFIPTTPFIVHMMVVGAFFLYRATGPIRASRPDIPEAVRQLDATVTERVVEEIERLILNAVQTKHPEV